MVDTSRQNEEDPPHPRLSVEFNLEKTPLQTGQTQPRVTLVERVRMGLSPRAWRGWLIAWFLLLILAVGGLVEYATSGVISNYVRHLLGLAK